MRAIDAVSAVFAKFAALLAKLGAATAVLRRQPDFVCGDCERWARCGLASSEDCVIRAAQIARGDWAMRRRARASSLVMGWPMRLVDAAQSAANPVVGMSEQLPSSAFASLLQLTAREQR